MIHFFGYFKATNHIGITSVGFEKAVIFLRNIDFRVVELFGLKDNEEVNLLYENEDLLWITKDHHLYIQSLVEENDYSPLTHVKIELAEGGSINYSAASLYVKYPDGEDIKSKTIMLLQTMGYYAAEKIFDFCIENPEMHLLELVFGMEPDDITDELERIKSHTDNIQSEMYLKEQAALISRIPYRDRIKHDKDRLKEYIINKDGSITYLDK